MSNLESFLDIDLSLPNHLNKLSDAEAKIDTYKTRFSAIQKSGRINNTTHESLFDDTVIMLDYLGRLSEPVFKVEDIIEQAYLKCYAKSKPEEVKKMWYEHYELAHRPYSLLKNRCYRILDDLDDEFMRVNKTFPCNLPKNYKPL